MDKGKFVIELNKTLTVKHSNTNVDGKDVADEKIFEAPTCSLNWSDDVVEFKLEINNNNMQDVKELTKIVTYEYMNSQSFKKLELELPIVLDDSTEESDITTLYIYAGFKDILLNLFSPHKKSFNLTVIFEKFGMDYCTTFTVLVPNIDQKDWNARVSKTKIYKPEEVCGIELNKLFRRGFKLDINSTKNESKLRCELIDYADASTKRRFTEFNFLEMQQRMLAIEDLWAMKEMEDFSLTFQKVTHYQTSRLQIRQAIEGNLKFLLCEKKMRQFLHRTYVIEATKKMPSDAQEFDFAKLTDMQDFQQFHDDLFEIEESRHTCKVHYIFDNLILVQLVLDGGKKRNRKQFIDEDRPYHVEFQPNRIGFRVGHRALEDAVNNKLDNYLCDFSHNSRTEDGKKIRNITKFKWMNSTIAGNKEQMCAIKNIVNKASFPSPYIIFGPPGTGKSTTIIEAIAQIVKLKPLSHILVTTRSNAANDDIGNRLLKYVSKNKILRIYSPSFDKKPEKINKSLEPISNFRNRTLCNCGKRSCPEIQPCDDPTYEEFYTSRVIIATLVSCGRIVSAGIKSTHFDYIFIDEAACENEQITLIPISGLGTSGKGIHAQIVLAGDHKQLGPIVQANFCRRMGMEKSMMERMMETNQMYQRSPNYNSQFVTQLVQNYRSHPSILQFSNENFYDSQLKSMCKPEIANFACGWDLLMYNKDFPLLFHTTFCPSKEVGTSLENIGEITLLDSYVRALLGFGINGKDVHESDIGIISPYRAQRDRISEQFEGEYPKIEIGTVDSFQGREKKIIIMSTVRSQTSHVGFLRNEKRLNVALTRAQCLLIIIGNASTLQKCIIWNKFVAFCHENRAIVGDVRSFDGETVQAVNYAGNEEKPEDVDDEYE